MWLEISFGQLILILWSGFFFFGVWWGRSFGLSLVITWGRIRHWEVLDCRDLRMDRRSWLWRRKSSEKSPGETESSGSVSSYSERYSDDKVLSAGSFGSSVLLFSIFQFFDSFLTYENSSYIYDCQNGLWSVVFHQF